MDNLEIKLDVNDIINYYEGEILKLHRIIVETKARLASAQKFANKLLGGATITTSPAETTTSEPDYTHNH